MAKCQISLLKPITKRNLEHITILFLRGVKDSQVISFPCTSKTSLFDPFIKEGEIKNCNFKEMSEVKDMNEIDTKKYLKAFQNAFKPIFESFKLDWEVVVNAHEDVRSFFDTDTDIFYPKHWKQSQIKSHS